MSDAAVDVARRCFESKFWGQTRQEEIDMMAALIGAYTSDLTARLASAEGERDEAREVVAKVNNSFGSYGYFTNPHPADEVEKLKAFCRADGREIERLKAAVEQARPVVEAAKRFINAPVGDPDRDGYDDLEFAVRTLTSAAGGRHE